MQNYIHQKCAVSISSGKLSLTSANRTTVGLGVGSVISA